MDTLTFERGSGQFKVRLDPLYGWFVEFGDRATTDPEPPVVDDPLFEWMHTHAVYGAVHDGYHQGNEQRATVDQLLRALTPEEVPVLLGYLTHVCEQSHKHVLQLHAGMGAAIEAKRWDAVATVSDELVSALHVMDMADCTARLALEGGGVT